MLNFSFDESDIRLQTAIRTRGAEIAQKMLPAMDAADIKLQTFIQTQELHGQILSQRTGKLANSIRTVPAIVEGTTVVGVVQGAGGPAWYGKLHEQGGTFIARRAITHPAHLIRRKGGEKVPTGSPYGIHFQKRAFMQPAADRFGSQIAQTLLARLNQVVTGEI